MPTNKERAVIVTTKHRGVFFGYTKDGSGELVQLSRARMAIYWGTTKGVMQLAETGPTDSSKISARADVLLHDVTAVFEVASSAADAWEKA